MTLFLNQWVLSGAEIKNNFSCAVRFKHLFINYEPFYVTTAARLQHFSTDYEKTNKWSVKQQKLIKNTFNLFNKPTEGEWMFILTCYKQFSSWAEDEVAIPSHSETDWYKNLSAVECVSWGEPVQTMKQDHVSAPWCVSLMFISTWLSLLYCLFRHSSSVVVWMLMSVAPLL